MIRLKTERSITLKQNLTYKRGYRHTRGDFWIFLYQSTIDTDSGLASVAEDREKSEIGPLTVKDKCFFLKKV